jgi:hypothetical protein
MTLPDDRVLLRVPVEDDGAMSSVPDIDSMSDRAFGEWFASQPGVAGEDTSDTRNGVLQGPGNRVCVSPKGDTHTNSAARDGRFSVESWAVFRDRAADSIPCVVEGLWPEGAMGFIAGPPKKGKTWLALAFALAVQSGKPFLGRFRVPEPRPVLYVAMEGTRAGLRARTGALARGMGLDPDGDLDGLHWAYKPQGLNLSDPEWAERLVSAADEIDAGLVVIDVLRRAAAVREDGNGAEDFMRLMRNLDPLGIAGRAVALVHHFGKASETNKARGPAERMAGSGALHGAMDTGLFIVKSANDARTFQVMVESRDLAQPEPFTVKITGQGTGVNRGFTFRDSAAVTLDDSEVPSADNVLLEQLREIRRATPGISQDAAAAAVGLTRFRGEFVTAWAKTQPEGGED